MVRQNGKSLVASFQKNSFIKGRVATKTFTDPIQVLFKIVRVLQGNKIKKIESARFRKSVRVRVSLEEKRMSVLALAPTLTLFSAPLTAESCNWLKDFLMIKSGFQNFNFCWT